MFVQGLPGDARPHSVIKDTISLKFSLELYGLTWCDCTPAETPPSPSIIAICVEDDLHCVALACDDCWQLEVPRRRWVFLREPAALVHQGCPVPINNFDKVEILTLRLEFTYNFEEGELQNQYLPAFHLYFHQFLNVVGIM